MWLTSPQRLAVWVPIRLWGDLYPVLPALLISWPPVWLQNAFQRTLRISLLWKRPSEGMANNYIRYHLDGVRGLQRRQGRGYVPRTCWQMKSIRYQPRLYIPIEIV
ncbi:hypothetical protein BKA70DRAFT_1260885 [Coprinopsis sp. MPI-PUGE-AT-0042]|nr:hypothetical protein BKA70DRAFT_1260885 [Coprinopsis sp. MPI-PUGE-AT-0042]